MAVVACLLAAPTLVAGRPIPAGVSEPARGTLLIAAPSIDDPRFARSVILLMHAGNGAAGVIVNRRDRVNLAHAFPDLAGLVGKESPLYYGGPVARAEATALVYSNCRQTRVPRLLADVYLPTGLAQLKQLLASPCEGQRVRIFAGYAGWAPGQLDGELARGDWLLAPATAARVFNDDGEALWQRLYLRYSGQWVRNRRAAAPAPG